MSFNVLSVTQYPGTDGPHAMHHCSGNRTNTGSDDGKKEIAHYK